MLSVDTPHALQLYRLVISHLSDEPDVAIVQSRQPVPEEWPLILQETATLRGQFQHFLVSDGKRAVQCVTAVPDLQRKVMNMEAGAIIHLIGAEVRFDDATRTYILDVQDTCTLKEFDTRLKQREREQAERLAWMKAQGYLDDAAELGASSASAPSSVSLSS
ncbi:MAG: hypothetical protein IPK79_03805 [Vampirovibrionales bacterium]|nr:hypothetical protein [Vampirovibrionales bacterium]